MAIEITDLTDKQKLEAADLENKIRAIDKYIEDKRTQLQSVTDEAYQKINVAEVKKREILVQLQALRTVTEK